MEAMHYAELEEMVCSFLERQITRINIAYLSGEVKDPYDATITSQRCNLSDVENVHLLEILPEANSFVRYHL
jgi:hypothetical protein